MACSHPLAAYQSASGAITFKRRRETRRRLSLPCGQCIRCKLQTSGEWATRCMHEAKLYDQNCFLTLTLDNSSLNRNLSLDHTMFQKFMKRLRKKFSRPDIRYFMCGEYGEQHQRPHYHACIFNLDFPDKLYYKRNGDNTYYTSHILTKLWPFGFATIGTLTYESAAYVARYATKAATQKYCTEQKTSRTFAYELYDYESGEIHERKPEYGRSSNRPGIGLPWLLKYFSDVYPKGQVLLKNKHTKAPKYYDKKFKELHLTGEYERMLATREREALKQAHDNTAPRLKVKEEVAIANLKRNKGTL